MSKASKKKTRLVASAQPGVSAVRSGAVSSHNDGNLPATGDGANLAKRSTDSLFGTQEPGYAEPDGLPTDANLDRINRRAREAFETTDKMGITRRVASAPAEGGLPYEQNTARMSDRAIAASTPAVQVAALDKALGEIDKAASKVRNGRDAQKFSKLERLAKAREAVVTARESILSKSGRDSAGTDSTMRMVASKESAASGYQAAVAGIAKLQKNQR